MTLPMTLPPWFTQRAPRERIALVAGTVVALLLGGYGWLWMPLAEDTLKLRAGVPQLRAQATQLAADTAEVKRLAATPKTQVAGDALAPGIEQSALAAGMKDKLRMLPLDTGRVQISSEGIGFNEWIGLLATLQQTRMARVESARVEPVPGSTLVRAQAVLSRSPANN